MSTTLWSYVFNPFASLSSRNTKQFYFFARDHRDKLANQAADPDIAPLYTRIQPLFDAFEASYVKVDTNTGAYRTRTAMLENLRIELATKARKWDIGVQNIYDETSPEYQGIFTDRRSPFNSGAYDDRIRAVETLIQRMAGYPLLATISADVQAFYTQINTARTAQQGFENNDQLFRRLLIADSQKLAVEMHYVFGALIMKHYQQPDLIETYYELKYLRTGTQNTNIVMKSYAVSGNGRVTLFAGQLAADSFLKIKNTGAVDLYIFTSSDPNAVVPAGATVLTAGNTIDGQYADTLTDGNGFNWLVVVNDGGVDGAVEVGKE